MLGYPCFTPSAQKIPYQIAESGAFRHVPSSAMARSTISRETPVSTMSSVDCAISLPIHREGEVPVGLMLAASGGSDHRILELAAAMEGVIRV